MVEDGSVEALVSRIDILPVSYLGTRIRLFDPRVAAGTSATSECPGVEKYE